MKQYFLSLALLASTMATAGVELHVKARYGTDEIEEIFDLTEEAASCHLQHPSGIHVDVALKEEMDNAATFALKITQNESRDLSDVTFKVHYGEAKSFKCTADNVDAELELIAFHQS